MATGKNANQLVGSVLDLLNNSSNLELPYSGYVGSFFFGPNQEISFTRYLPKGRVRIGSNDMDGKSFGNGWKRDKMHNLHFDFFTNHNYRDTQGNKDVELLTRYSSLIEDALRNNVGSYGGFMIVDMEDDVEPQRAEEIENNLWVVSKRVTFKERS